MNRKARILLIGTVLAISGIVIKGTGNANANLPENLSTQTNYTSISSELTNIDSIAQYGGSPWGQVVNSKTYTNPDTGQKLCFYSSSRWAPCPGQGDKIIISPKGKCWGGESTEDYMNGCPAAVCAYHKVRSRANEIAADHYGNTNTVKSSAPPCNGLP
ncbi:hypothetical protein [Dapis sp. BLCC M172]|uniref:hypothetical protein n=1 Tax=Dapis sp. BLCC M172 TaxID=2975281 RepID=UPI003CFB9209